MANVTPPKLTGTNEVIHSAIVANDPAALLEACRANVDVNAKFGEEMGAQHAGMTPLALACALNRVELVKILVRFCADVNSTFAALQTTALMTSSFHGHASVVLELLNNGSDARVVDLQGSTALGYCFGGSRSVDVVSLLIRSGVDVSRKNILGMNALLLTAWFGDETLVRTVLSAGADSNSTSDFGHSPLHLAVIGKRTRIGATISGASTPLYGLKRRNLDQGMKDWVHSHHQILRNVTPDLQNVLVKVGHLMMSMGEKMTTCNDNLTTNDQDAAVERLELARMVRYDIIQASNDSKQSKTFDTIKFHRRNPPPKSTTMSTSLLQRPFRPPIVASSSGDGHGKVSNLCEIFAKIIRLLLDSGSRVETREKEFGLTALDMAIIFGDIESTALLTAAGGNPDHLMQLLTMSDLHTHIIVKPDKKRVKDMIIADKHLDINDSWSNFNVPEKSQTELAMEKLDGYPRGDSGLTPLAGAAKALDSRTMDIVKLLLKHEADINRIGFGGRSPLGEACRYGNVRMVELLVKEGANMELRHPAFKSATPLIIAVIFKQIATVEYLIGQGAKIDVCMSDSRTPLDKAMEAIDMPMIDTLLIHADLNLNFVSMNGPTYRLAVKYKRPDRNIGNILKEISENVKAILEREKQSELEKVKMRRKEEEDRTRRLQN